MTWHLITGEYPPERGGVADYTAILAAELADRGCDVHVWAPGNEPEQDREPSWVMVHRVCGRFGPAGLVRLGRGLNRFPWPRTILVQYVPQGFRWKGLNLPFAVWLFARRLFHRDDLRVMFHEVATPWSRRPRLAVLAAGTRLMALLAVRACTRAYVSIPSWERMLRRYCRQRLRVTWLPIPATIPAGPRTTGDWTARTVGHFGTYGQLIVEQLEPVLRTILERRPDVRILLLGTGGEKWRVELLAGRPEWAGRVVAPGEQSGTDLAVGLRSCDLVVQPYPDGASSRRTTLMAALANGVPVATTVGPLTESVWTKEAVGLAPAGDAGQLARVVLDLLDRPEELRRLGSAGRELYTARFTIGRVVDALLSDGETG